MKTYLTLAAAAAVALTASPALADPGHGHGDKEWKHGGGDRDDGDRGGYRNNYGYHHSSYRNCPPGLAKKHNGCMPPGQYRKAHWTRGQRLPNGYNSYTSYNQIPYSYRQRYNLDPNNRYIYQDNTIYQVDPRTSVIQQILGGLVR